ncbi:hypothetical protein CEP53_000036 [Fusarium sp. AF-6]|nr:hypothetical protein CEP53_000036 [Fusarium sp. AF-6]
MSKSTKDQDPPHQLAPAPSQNGEVYDDTAHDAVFGETTEDGPNYRNVGWLGTSALMMKTQIGLGVLSIPAVFDTLGMIPGLICLCTIAAITTWSDWMVGAFKLRHREVYSIADAGQLMFGPIGREILGVGFCLYWIFVSGSGMLGVSIGLNSVSTHGACTVVFVAVAAIVGFGCASIRTLSHVAYGMAIPGLIVSTTLTIHDPSKYVFVRLLRDSKHLAANTMVHWATWLGCTFSTAFVAYIIASAIPVFGGLVSLIGALLGTLMSFQPMGCMWLYDNWSRGKASPSVQWVLMVLFSVSVIIMGTFLMVAGTYGSIVGIIDSYNMDGRSKPFSCADNSGSV